MKATLEFFKDFFKNAHENFVIIMNLEGNILYTNKAFRVTFGYKLLDLEGRHFRFLFTKEDQQINKPEIEIEDVVAKGSKSDNNYLVHANGSSIWVMGESILVKNVGDENFIVKIIQNINSQKQLEHFLLESKEFIDVIFDSIKDTALMTLDSTVKIIKTNKAFVQMFGLKKKVEEGSRIAQLDNPFWKSALIKQDVMQILLSNKQMKNTLYQYTRNGVEKQCSINSKTIVSNGEEKMILLVIKNVELKK